MCILNIIHVCTVYVYIAACVYNVEPIISWVSEHTRKSALLPLYSAQLINTEQERDKLSIEINRLGMQCQQLKSTQERLVAEHSKTLERVNELWKQKWPGAYDEVSYTLYCRLNCGMDYCCIFLSGV